MAFKITYISLSIKNNKEVPSSNFEFTTDVTNQVHITLAVCTASFHNTLRKPLAGLV